MSQWFKHCLFFYFFQSLFLPVTHWCQGCFFFFGFVCCCFFTVTVAKLNKIFLKYWFGILIRLCLQISFFNKWKAELFNEWKAELFSCAVSLVRCFRVMWYSKWMTGIIRWLTGLIRWLTGHIRYSYTFGFDLFT